MPLSAATTRYGSSASWRTHLRRRHDLAADEVVGDVEQAAEVVLVAGDALLHAAPRGRDAAGARFSTNPPFEPDRHDDDVLHHLRLDQAEHLGAEVLRPVGPAQAAARDLAAAQVHALEARRVDEDLEHRLRVGQPGHLRRVELEREERPPPAFRVAAPVVGASRGVDEREELPQHAVLVQVVDLVERLLDRVHLERRRPPASPFSGSKRSRNSLTSMRAIAGFAASVCSMKPCESGKPICRRYFA